MVMCGAVGALQKDLNLLCSNTTAVCHISSMETFFGKNVFQSSASEDAGHF